MSNIVDTLTSNLGHLLGTGLLTADEERLVAAGIRTVADIASARRADLERAVGLAAAAHLRELADGRDPRRVQPERAGKSIGSNRTFETDLTDADDLDRALLALAGRTCARARAQGVLGRTVALSVRWSDFTTVTRSRTLEVPTDSTRTVHRTAAALLAELAPRGRPVRLLGVRLEQLSDASVTPVQVTLDEPEHVGPEVADELGLVKGAYDDIVRVASTVCDTPVALVSPILPNTIACTLTAVPRSSAMRSRRR